MSKLYKRFGLRKKNALRSKLLPHFIFRKEEKISLAQRRRKQSLFIHALDVRTDNLDAADDARLAVNLIRKHANKIVPTNRPAQRIIVIAIRPALAGLFFVNTQEYSERRFPLKQITNIRCTKLIRSLRMRMIITNDLLVRQVFQRKIDAIDALRRHIDPIIASLRRLIRNDIR